MQTLLANFIPAALDIDVDPCAGQEGQRFLAAIGKLPSWKSSTETGPRDRPQGQYICSPRGELLAWCSSADIQDNGEKGSYGGPAGAAVIQATMQRALKKWGKPSVEEQIQSVKSGKLVLNGEKNFLASFHAKDGAILRFVCRDLPRPKDSNGTGTHWSSDYYRREWNINYGGFDLRRFLPATLEPGAKREVPAELIQRLAEKYFLDNAHGSPPSYYRVKKGQMTAEVVNVEDGVASVRLQGETRTADGAHGCGFDAKILGRASYHLTQKRFASFELVVVGTRVGVVPHSGRGPWGAPEDVGPAPMGIVAVLVERE